jgi:hypothetical protein
LRARRDARKPKSPAFEAFVRHHKAASIPEQNLAAVRSLPQKNEKMPAVWVSNAERAHQGEQPIVSAPHVDRLSREPDLHARRQHHPELASSSARASDATYLGEALSSNRRRKGPTASSSDDDRTTDVATRTGNNLGTDAAEPRVSTLDQ